MTDSENREVFALREAFHKTTAALLTHGHARDILRELEAAGFSLSLLADRARMEKALREIENEHGAVQPVGAGDGSTFIVNDHVAARNMRKIAREGLGVSQ